MTTTSRLARLALAALLVGLLGAALLSPQAGVEVARGDGPTVKVYLPMISRDSTVWPYIMQKNYPIYMQNWTNTLGCKWMAIAGQVFALNKHSVTGLSVHLVGGNLDVDTTTGPLPNYGSGPYYEVYLLDHVVSTQNTYRLQLRQDDDTSLSAWYTIPTLADCTKNLILVNFVQQY